MSRRDLCPGGVCPGFFVQGGLCLGGIHPGGLDPPVRKRVGSTHPTGMPSCL